MAPDVVPLLSALFAMEQQQQADQHRQQIGQEERLARALQARKVVVHGRMERKIPTFGALEMEDVDDWIQNMNAEEWMVRNQIEYGQSGVARSYSTMWPAADVAGE
jgi:ribosomal protein L9